MASRTNKQANMARPQANELPAWWGTKSPKPKMRLMLLKLANMATPQSYTFWDLIFEPIRIAAAFMEDDIHEAALPIHEDTIRAWSSQDANWQVPPFKITTDNMQGALCKEIGRLYKLVIDNYSTHTEEKLVPWTCVLNYWSQCASFFRTFWFLHPHLSKKEAFTQARAIGEKKIILESHRRKVQNSLQSDAKLEYHSRRINILLSTSLHKVTPDDNDQELTEDYFMYNDEERAQEMLKEFFALKMGTIGNYQDMACYAKKWIVSKNATLHDKDHYKQFSNIYSAKEVARQKKRTKRPREKAADPLEMSRGQIEKRRATGLRQLFEADARRKVKFQANFRMKLAKLAVAKMKLAKLAVAKMKTKRANPPSNVFKPLLILEVRWDSSWRGANTVAPGGFIWCTSRMNDMNERSMSEFLHYLFASVEGFRLEIPSLTRVDDSIDKGNLRQKVEACKSTILKILNEPRFKCKQVKALKKLILKAWKAEDEYRNETKKRISQSCASCEGLVQPDHPSIRCNTCSSTIHTNCGHRFRGSPMDCIPCSVDKQNNPPLLLLDEDGEKVVEPAGSNWGQLQLEKYNMIANFVNSMMTKPGDVAASLIQEANADPQADPQAHSKTFELRPEACEVLIALKIHDFPEVTPKWIMELAQEWLPEFYRPSFSIYLALFKKIAITRACKKNRTEVLGQYTKQVEDAVSRMLQDVRSHHRKGMARNKGIARNSEQEVLKAVGTLTNMKASSQP
jgi:hypothetical protein